MKPVQLIFLYGQVASGKLTVARALAAPALAIDTGAVSPAAAAARIAAHLDLPDAAA